MRKRFWVLLACAVALVAMRDGLLPAPFIVGGYKIEDMSTYDDLTGVTEEGDLAAFRVSGSGELYVTSANSSRFTGTWKAGDIPPEPLAVWNVAHYTGTFAGSNQIIQAGVMDLDAPLPPSGAGTAAVVAGGLGWTAIQANEPSAPNQVFPGPAGWRMLATNKLENFGIKEYADIQVFLPSGDETGLVWHLRQGAFKANQNWLRFPVGGPPVRVKSTSSLGIGLPPGIPASARVVINGV